MKLALFNQVILTAVITFSLSQSAFSQADEKYPEYTGLYTDTKNEHTKLVVLEDNGILYIQSLAGIYQVIFSSKTDIKLMVQNESTAPAHFSEFKNGKYHKLNMGQGVNKLILKRDDIPESKCKSVLYEAIDRSDFLVGFNKTKLPPGQSPDIETVSIEEAGGNRSLIKKLIRRVSGRVNCLLISKNSRLVVEEYFNGYSAEDSQRIASVTKSIVSLLLGEAIEKKYIRSINDRIVKYLPEYKSILVGEKKKITVKDLAEMSSGLEWYEWDVSYFDPENINQIAAQSPDPVKFVLSQPLIHKPGKVFAYNSGSTPLIMKIIKNAAGAKTFAEFAIHSNLSRLDFKNAYWIMQNSGREGNFLLRPRDMIKIGQLVLNNGMWNGEQIVSKKWILESTKRHIDTGSSWDGYGYQWWHKTFRVGDREFKAVAAYGFSGQKIVIIKELDMVIVTTREFSDRPVLIITDQVIEAFI